MLVDFEEDKSTAIDTKATHTANFYQKENGYLRTKVGTLENKNKKYMEMLTSHSHDLGDEKMNQVDFGQISKERKAEGDLKEETQQVLNLLEVAQTKIEEGE